MYHVCLSQVKTSRNLSQCTDLLGHGMTDDLREVGQQEWVPCKSHNLPKIVENLQGKACEDGNYKTYFLQTINI